MEEQGKSKNVRLVINIPFIMFYADIQSLPSFFRIQTGKLSEFLTTSCFAHLSFLDSGKVRSSSLTWGEYEDDDYSFDNEDSMHDLNISDGMEHPQDTAASLLLCR